MSDKDGIIYDTDDYEEAKLIAGFVKWAQKNSIPINEHSYAEIEEYIMRYLKAAG